jgi:hypothetical protein
MPSKIEERLQKSNEISCTNATPGVMPALLRVLPPLLPGVVMAGAVLLPAWRRAPASLA